MVICIIALPVFAILGLFSLRYRTLTAEAFRCLVRTTQFKPCDTGLDQRIKSKFTAKLMWWPGLARGFYKYFEILSWIFVVLLLVSAGLTGYGLYNYIVYGDCNGPDDDGFCIFNVVDYRHEEECSVFEVEQEIYADRVKSEGYPVRGAEDAVIELHEFGCYSCPYTQDAEFVVREILQDYPEVKLVYHDLPLDIHDYSVEGGQGAICAGRQDMYWEYHDLLMERDDELNEESFTDFALMLGLNMSAFRECFDSNETLDEIAKYRIDALEVGIYGTPTFVIGDDSLVGPQKYKTLKSLIEKRI